MSDFSAHSTPHHADARNGKATAPSLLSRDNEGHWLVGSRDGVVYDLEVYPNFFCGTFFNGVMTKTFDHTQLSELAVFVTDTAKVLIGYNNFAYDDPMLRAIVNDPKRIVVADLYVLSGLLIADRGTLSREQIQRRNSLIYARCPWAYSIDLFEVTNRKASLKEHECRLGLPVVADSPVPFDQAVSEADIPVILAYNRNDVLATATLLEVSREQIELRAKLSLDYNLGRGVYVMGDAKVAEHFMLTRYKERTGTLPAMVKNLAAASAHNVAPSFPLTDLIPPVVTFTTAPFQAAFEILKRGTVVRTPKGTFQLVTDLPGNRFIMEGLTLSLGCGGLHSDDEPAIFRTDESGELWDVDAASFYPGQMIAYGIKPSHLLAVFLEELTILRDRRLAAKAAGDKLTANSLKLVINSIFGKLHDLYSPLRDDKAFMRVTIGGQILLLMLVEAVTVAGANVLSANTDGLLLRVPTDKAEAVYASLRAWEARTRLSLEEQGYTVFARRDVNNYVAISAKLDKNGQPEVKSKGAYNTDAAKLSGSIIPIAVQEHLRTGKPLKDVIQQHLHAKDFLFYQRAQSDGRFEYKGAVLPKTIRWYAADSDDADPIQRVGADGTSRTTVPHGQKAKLALELPENYTRADLPGLDLDAYVAHAQKLLNSALASIEVERGTTQARQLQKTGLTLLPQRDGKNPAGVALDDIGAITALKDRRCECWAVVTGAATQTLVFDLDYLQSLDPKLLDLLQRYPTMTTWHGQGSADQVRAGRKRGAVTFRYEGLDARISTRATSAWVGKHGFEVAFGKKVQTVIGQHRTAGDDYAQDGTVAEAPADLIEYLGLRLGPPRKRKQAEPELADEGDLEVLRQAADAVLGAGWANEFQARDGVCGVEGITPGHTSRMRLGVRRGRVWGHSFHVSYDTPGTVAMVQAEYDRLRPDSGGPGSGPGTGGDPSPNGDQKTEADEAPSLDPSDMPPPQTPEELRTASDCAEAFALVTGIGVIIGATGTGKSWQATLRAIERHGRGERTLLVAPDKEGIEQLRRYTLGHWTAAGRDPKDLLMQTLTSTSAIDEEDEEDESDTESAKSAIKKNTLIVITHHHYCSRKPLTTKLYSVLYWVETHAAEVILDEGDLYIERQNCHLQLDARYTLIGGRDRGQWTRSNHCPSAKGSFRCKGCHKRSGGRVVNLTTHFAYRSPFQLMPSQFDQLAAEEFTILPENLPLDQTIDLPSLNMRLSGLAQTPGYLAQRDFSRRRTPQSGDADTRLSPKQEMLEYLRDLIDCSHLPTMADPRLVDDAQRLVEDDPQKLALSTDPEGMPLLDGIKTASWKFPYFLCDTRFLLLYDRAPTFFMMLSASRFIIMSATIGEQHLGFLHDCAHGEPVVTVTIPTPTRTPLEQVVIIGHQGRVDWMGPLGERAAKAMGCDYSDVGLSNRTTVERLGNALSAAGKPPLVFMPTKEDAKAVFIRMKERGWNFYIEGEYRMHRGQAAVETDTTNGSMGLISYARSSLGTGANLPQYDVVVVDGTVRRPHYVFNPALKTEDAYLEAQESDRVRIMVQNVGRILRGSGVKFVLVVGITPAQVVKLAKEVERLATTKTASWFTGDDTVRAMAAIVASVKAGHLVVPEVPKAQAKSRERQSRKQRAAADAADQAGGAEDGSGESVAKALIRVQELAREGKTWRSASRAVNASRYVTAIANILKAAHAAAFVKGASSEEVEVERDEADEADDEEADSEVN